MSSGGKLSTRKVGWPINFRVCAFSTMASGGGSRVFPSGADRSWFLYPTQGVLPLRFFSAFSAVGFFSFLSEGVGG